MDNPQEIEKFNKKRWLAGFFDVNGSIGIKKNPFIDISNTSSRTRFYIGLILNKLNIDYSTNSNINTKSSKNPRWDIFIRDKNILYFINAFINNVYGKRKQLDLMNEYLLCKDDKIDYEEKIQFINQFNNIIINKNKMSEVETIVNNNYFDKYADIVFLNDDDKEIVTYDTFNDFCYIAGILDASGNFTISHYNNKYIVSICLINTNKEVIKRFCSVLKNNQIGYHINFRDASTVSIRRRWDITIYGWKKCYKLCNKVSDKMHTKKEQCELIKEYCYYNILNDNYDEKLGASCKKALENIKKGLY